MHEKFALLAELQAVDVRLATVRAALAEFPKRLAAAEARLEAARQQLAASKASHTQSSKDRKTYEMDVDSWKEKARKYKDQSGQVKSNEAYRALLHEIENAEKEVAKAEDRLLDRMVAGEEFDHAVKSAEAALKAAEAEVAAERVTLAKEKAAVETDAAALSAEHEKVIAGVPADLVQLYQQVAKRHHGIALAAVREESSCGQCGFMVRPHVVQEIRRGTEEIFRCDGCGRILYYPEAAAQAAAAPAQNS